MRLISKYRQYLRPVVAVMLPVGSMFATNQNFGGITPEAVG
jgi:hypothetical protein